jgi:hypothetical protein
MYYRIGATVIRPYVFALLYGNHSDLHQRILTGLMRTLPADVPIELWCNQVCDSTRQFIESNARFKVTFSAENVPKYKAMRKLFEPFRLGQRPEYNWVIWFDDDTTFSDDGWFNKAVQHLEMRANPCCMGQVWYVNTLPGQLDFFRVASWHKGRPERIINNKPGRFFATGSYWWLKVNTLKALDWPDPRLSHNGGDTLLGEALWQQGLEVLNFSQGVSPNKAARRGLNETPAGATKQERR